ncbi:MAG TPA: hypothetical protein VFW45_16540 [Candidatus Polarisedimenticolia bacterium]|nr:hypothetical protein [Candidatus Polarisedimenticolia bacterium]
MNRAISCGRDQANERNRSRESGHLLIAVMIGITLLLIFMTVVAQQWSSLERRENEKELIFRGNQYAKAIKKYQGEHGGAYPTSLESLMELGPRRLRYIRRLYRDPMAPDGKWGILIADPSGKGFINPNAPQGEGEGIPGLDDLGQGLDEFDEKLKRSNQRNQGQLKIFKARSGLTDWTQPEEDGKDKDGKVSVTAPGQPVGPIVGVVSLWDQMSFRRYHEHENYTEWTFSIFDLNDQKQQQAKPDGGSAPTNNMGPCICSDKCCTGNCPPGYPPQCGSENNNNNNNNRNNRNNNRNGGR